MRSDFIGRKLGFADNPFVTVCFTAGGIKLCIPRAFVHLAIARGVPDFGGEVAVAFDAAGCKLDIAAQAWTYARA